MPRGGLLGRALGFGRAAPLCGLTLTGRSRLVAGLGHSGPGLNPGRLHRLEGAGDLDTAIELYHQSLSLKPDDTFTCEMLSEALKDTLDVGFDFGGPTSRAGSAAASASAMDIL